ncbi:MAG: M48 family metalloprotease [Vicinamibacterales bacterium]
MAETPAPLLVYDRIDANRRNTYLLTVAFAALLLPFVWAISQFLASLLVRSSGRFPAQPGRDGIVAMWIVVPAIVLAVAIAHLSSLYLFVVLVWRSGARRLASRDEPELRRVIDNLCIAAGQPVPSLYIIESAAPNAFAVGFDPQHARLIVTRGLLDLLEPRELAAVLAHELSHIANGDTNLSTTLAVLVGIVRLPLSLVTGSARYVRSLLGRRVAVRSGGAMVLVTLFFLSPIVAVLLMASFPRPGHLAASPVSLFLLAHLFFVAPAVALWLRKHVSHQREFLADADAVLLTRDPEGLALALAKVSAAAGSPVHAGDAIAHLFFVDPLPVHAFGRAMFPSHPPVDVRIDAVTRMGDGFVEGLRKAEDAGVDYRGRTLLNEVAPGVQLETATRVSLESAAESPGSQFRLTDHSTPLYETADGWSRMLQQLPAGDVVTLTGVEGRFARVQAAGLDGYIAAAAGAERLDAVGEAPGVPRRGLADRS